MANYIPINPLAYYAAHAGAISGMAIPGWIVDPNKVDYATVVGIAAAFAQAFDQAWDNIAPLSIFEAEAITAVVASDFQQRGPGPLAFAQYSNPANWNIAAAACVALILECDAFFAGHDLTPPPYPSAGLLSTAFNESANIVLPYSATPTIPTVVVTVPNVTVPPNCKVIAHFNGVAQAGEDDLCVMTFMIGRGTSPDSPAREITVWPGKDYDVGAQASSSFAYTFEYSSNSVSGQNLSFNGLAMLMNEINGSDPMLITSASLLIEVVSV